MDVAHAVGRRQPDNLVERPEVVTQDSGGQRRPQTGLDGQIQPLHDALEGPRATDRVVDLGGRAVETDLEPETPSTRLPHTFGPPDRGKRGFRGRDQPGQALQTVALEQGAVGEDDELAAVGRDHSLREVEDVRARQRAHRR